MTSNGIEKVLRDLRIFRIFEGTNDILRLFVGLTGIPQLLTDYSYAVPCSNIATIGLQHACGHLKQVQRALKNPAANVDVIFGEAAKRAKRAVGIANANMLADCVHPNLALQGSLTSKAIEAFGVSVEGLLIKYGKDVLNQQYLLNRLSAAAIDIYSNVVVLSRATRSANLKLASASHEEKIARVWCNEALDRIQLNLTALKSPSQLSNFKAMSEIAGDMCENGGLVQQNPLGI